MKFSYTLDIKAPRDKVVELFTNPDKLQYWQDGFEKVEYVSGEAGEIGAKKNMVYNQKGRKMELLETIITNDLPNEFSALYQHIHMENTMTSRFSEIEDGKSTRYEAEIEYTKFIGLAPRIMAFLFPSMFKKQGRKWFEQLKAYAEKENHPSK